jgi:hypothetical protein
VQWYNLGWVLGITPETLDIIKRDNIRRPDHCFTAMLTTWLREHERPTWSALAEALRSPSVGLSHLAEEIQHQPTSSANEKEKLISKTGMFPHYVHVRTRTVIHSGHMILVGVYSGISLVMGSIGISTPVVDLPFLKIFKFTSRIVLKYWNISDPPPPKEAVVTCTCSNPVSIPTGTYEPPKAVKEHATAVYARMPSKFRQKTFHTFVYLENVRLLEMP